MKIWDVMQGQDRGFQFIFPRENPSEEKKQDKKIKRTD